MISGVEQSFRLVPSFAAFGIEVAAISVVAFVAIEALLGSVRPVFDIDSPTAGVRQVWVRFAGWILLSLKFTLAAIRRALNCFLGLDIGEAEGYAVDIVSHKAG